MPVVLLIAVVVIVAVAVFCALGRGGQLSAERTDYAPLELGPVTATDVALLRPPTSLWGYDVQATDDAMDRIAESIRERDVRIVALEQLVTDLGRGQSAPSAGSALPARRRPEAGEPAGEPSATPPEQSHD